MGFKFRRQHPIGRFIADFYCPAARLVIEVVGISHSMGDHPQRDLDRDRWLASQNVRVVRFAAADVLQHPDSVVIAILFACRC